MYVLSESFSYLDRKGLGYGQLKQSFHAPRKLAGAFPYIDPDKRDIEDVELDNDDYESVDKKTYDFPVIDPGKVKVSDPLYYAGAATKLRACFERPSEMLEEIAAIGRILPVSGEYEEDDTGYSIGGYSSAKAFDQRPYKRTGTKKGWSEAPPLSKVEAEDEVEEEEFYDLKDLTTIQRRSLGECFDFYIHT